MHYKNQLNCYCFNKECQLSIYSADCLAVEVPLETVLSKKLNCIECGRELLPPVLIEIKRDVMDLIKMENHCTISIVDDDIIFHETVKALLKKQQLLKGDFYSDGISFITAQENNVDNNKKITNLLFLDLHMPDMDGWELLNRFEQVNERLDNPVSVYIISNSLDPADHERAKKHKYVKSFISKPLTRLFLERINNELGKIIAA